MNHMIFGKKVGGKISTEYVLNVSSCLTVTKSVNCPIIGVSTLS